MLVITRRESERLRIGPDIFITIVRIGCSTVKLGIDAPQDTNIVREEIDTASEKWEGK